MVDNGVILERALSTQANLDTGLRKQSVVTRPETRDHVPYRVEVDPRPVGKNAYLVVIVDAAVPHCELCFRIALEIDSKGLRAPLRTENISDDHRRNLP